MERQRHRARAAVLAHRQHPLGEAVALAHVRLEVDRRQVRRASRSRRSTSRAITRVAVDARRQLDDVDEPRALVVVVVGERRLDVDAGEQLVVARGDPAPRRQDPVELLELADAERSRDVVEPVVVSRAARAGASSTSRAGPGCAARRAARAAPRSRSSPRRPRPSSSACSGRTPRPPDGRASRAGGPCSARRAPRTSPRSARARAGRRSRSSSSYSAG